MPGKYRGTWEVTCSPDEPGIPESGYGTFSVVLTANKSVNTFRMYDDLACTVPADEHEYIVTHSLVAHAASVSTDAGTATAVDMSLKQLSVDGEVFVSEEDVYYELFFATGSSLYFDLNDTDATAGDTAATRPTQIDTDIYYSKVQ